MAKTNIAGVSLRYSPLYLFLAGAISVFLFHQGTASIMHALGLAMPPFPYAPRPLFGISGFGTIPQIWSWVFWGGVWGIVYGAVEQRFPKGPMYWVAAFLFGAILTTLVLAFVVFPLRGLPVAFGWNPQRIIVAMIIHGMFGLGIALILRFRP